MKPTLFAIAILFSLNSLGQEWTSEQLEVIEKYDLSEKDNRGIIFTSDSYGCDVEASSQLEAIEAFFTPDIRKDLITVCVSGEPKDYYNKPLGVKEVIDIYISTTK
jgi:hypothetical protein